MKRKVVNEMYNQSYKELLKTPVFFRVAALI